MATATLQVENATTTLNLSTSRLPTISTTPSISAADSLPALNFNFDALRARMSSFTNAFDEFIERGRRRVLEERNSFRVRVQGVDEQAQQTASEIGNLRKTTAAHNTSVGTQTAEAQEMATVISSLTSTRDANAEKLVSLRKRLTSLKSQVQTRKEHEKERRAYSDRMDETCGEELHAWESALAMRVEGIQGIEDRVRFIFAFEPEDGGSKWKEGSFEMDLSGGRFEIIGTKPRTSAVKVEELVKDFEAGSGEDLGSLLKGLRALLASAL